MKTGTSPGSNMRAESTSTCRISSIRPSDLRPAVVYCLERAS